MKVDELLREARAIVPPIGASVAIAVHDGTHHRAAFLVNGRIRSAPVGPAFTKPRDACAFVDLLNGAAPRPTVDPDPARLYGGGQDVPPSPEAPVMGTDVSPSLPDAGPIEPAPGTCAGCGGPLPRGRRGQRRLTCSAACRQRVRYRRAATPGRADADSGAPNLTPSRPSPAEVLAAHVADVIAACNPELRTAVPTSSEVPSGGIALLVGTSRDAGANAFPEASPPTVPSLGL